MIGYHKSVLLKEVVDVLNIRDAWYLDATLGDGGHSIEIIKRGGSVIGIDVDPQALERVRSRFKELGVEESKFRLVQGNFRDLKNLIQPASTSVERGEQADTANQNFAGAIFDLGVSSLQLDTPEKGFSFMHEGPLDMRMDPSLQVKALDLVNALNKGELYELFTKLGEEKFAHTLAETLVFARKVKPITTTRELAEIIEKRLGRRGKIHPATLVFQALRIAVNDELNAIKEGLDQIKDLVKGRVVVISFHSLEDRIVKNIFKDWESRGIGKIVTEKPDIPLDDEVRENPRSRSAKMRVFKL